MALNQLKKEAGRTSGFADVAALYGSTQVHAPRDGIQNPFSWRKAEATLKSIGWSVTLHSPTPDTLDTLDFINWNLDVGNLVLASTTFGGSAWGVRGGGHVVLFTGKHTGTLSDGTEFIDYLVKDPAGDYFASVTRHYGRNRCGREARYPEDFVYANVSTPTQRPALAIHPEPGADPRTLLVIDRSGGTGDAFDFWVQGPDGMRVGWERDEPVEEWFSGDAKRDPPFESDPDAEEGEEVPFELWPRTILIERASPDLKLFVRGSGSGEATLEIYVVEDGVVRLQQFERVALQPGKTVSLRTNGDKTNDPDGGDGEVGASCGCGVMGGAAGVWFLALAGTLMFGRRRGGRCQEQERT